jgi:hypothetical protein
MRLMLAVDSSLFIYERSATEKSHFMMYRISFKKIILKISCGIESFTLMQLDNEQSFIICKSMINNLLTSEVRTEK